MRRPLEGGLVMVAFKKPQRVELLNDLESMLTRLKLTAIREQLGTLLDQAGRAELNLREALAMLCAAEVACKDERLIQRGMSIAKFPCVRWRASSTTSSPRWTPSRSASWRLRAEWPTATACCCSDHPAWTRRTWR